MKAVIKVISLILALLMFASCAVTEQTPVTSETPDDPELLQFKKTYIDYFDTASVIVGFDVSEEAFLEKCAVVEEKLAHFHKLYDIYNKYEGVNNIYVLNREAAASPVLVDEDIIKLFEFCQEMYDLTDGKTNYAMGSVLSIWHNYREIGMNEPADAEVPPMEKLEAAAQHCDPANVIIDKENSTVFFADPDLKIDVGAIGKGYATEIIAQTLEEMGVNNYTLNIGGNIRTIGPKGDGNPWVAGIQNPDMSSAQQFIVRVAFSDLSLVTSGSYQRYYYVGQDKYHHIIDPETLFPKDTFASVSIFTDHSGLADAVSTACFNISLEEGMALIESIENTEAMWVEPDGTVHYSSGFENFIVPEE